MAGVLGVAAALVAADPAAAQKRGQQGGYNPPYAAIVVDVKSGRTLHAENADARRFPASITKVMTLYMLFEQLEQGRLRLDSPLTVSAHAAAQAPSKLGLRTGSTIRVEDAILALVTKSANDVAAVVAENLGGSVPNFAAQMTQKARSLGMSQTVFRNASGLPDPGQVTTARDLSILAVAIQDRFPRYYRYFDTRTFNFAGQNYRNHNRLLGRVEGVDGIKTGFIRASGFNLMTNVKTDTRHIVTVVLGGRTGAARDQIVASLVERHLPRAYAGARRTAPVTESGARVVASAAPVAPAPASAAPAPIPPSRPFVVAEVETTAATSSRQPLDLNAMRPAVASAAGATSTTTPGSLRAAAGSAPAGALAYAAAPEAAGLPLPPAKIGSIRSETDAATRRSAAQPSPVTPETQVASADAAAVAEIAAEAASDSPARSPWLIQIGAVDRESAALTMLEKAQAQVGRVLKKAEPFTEKVSSGGGTLYRARFSGFDAANQAQQACQQLKRSGFACFAIRS